MPVRCPEVCIPRVCSTDGVQIGESMGDQLLHVQLDVQYILAAKTGTLQACTGGLRAKRD